MSDGQSILLTGGSGYVGSHTYVALVQAGFKPYILDNFSNSKKNVVERLECITGLPVPWHEGDTRDVSLLQEIIVKNDIAAVIHFAGFKSVSESVANPLKYFDNNLAGMIGLLKAMENSACRTLVFSSSATVYGDPIEIPITEKSPKNFSNPYGYTKIVCEEMLASLSASNAQWRNGVLRYFNPVGAHPSGLIGEDPSGPPNNLMPYLAQVAVGKLPILNVYGNDYPTPDGTGVRDYIHVQDLAEAHVAALKTLFKAGSGFTVNIGTGRGYSVMDVVCEFEIACGKSIPYQFVERRSGDIAVCYADATLAKNLLNWNAKLSLADMCIDSWRWQSNDFS